MQISELRPGAGFEVVGEITLEYEPRTLWQCFSCKNSGVSDKDIEICPKCGDDISKEKSKGLWIRGKVKTVVLKDDSGQVNLDLWNEDIIKYKKGDKIKVTNGFAKQYIDKRSGQKKLSFSKGKFGAISVITRDCV